MPFKTNLYPAIGVNNDGHRVRIIQRLVQYVLALVYAPLFEGNALATPGATQCVGRISNCQGINDGNIGHGQPPEYGLSNSTTPHRRMSSAASLCLAIGPDIMSLALGKLVPWRDTAVESPNRGIRRKHVCVICDYQH